MNYRDKVIMITGASSGIGEALAYAFARDGAKLIISSRNAEALEKVKQKCQCPPGNVVVFPLDLSEPGPLLTLGEKAASFFGRIDILVNNGGVSQRALAAETDFDVDRRIMNVNYLGAVALTKSVLPVFLQQGAGHIVIVSSLMGKIGTPLRSGYAASKHALHGYFDSLRAEMHRKGIRVTIVCPGFIRTNISVNALSASGIFHGFMDEKQSNGMSPEVCAKKILRAVHSQKEEVYIGGMELLSIYLKRYLPRLFSRIIRSVAVT